MSVLISFAQNSNKCFSPVEIDSLYNKFVYFDFIGKENTALKVALSASNKVKAEQNTKIRLLEANQIKYKDIINNYELLLQNRDETIRNKEILYKAQKKKKVLNLFKGILIGAGGVLIYNTIR